MGSGDMEGLGLEKGLVGILIMLMKRFWTCEGSKLLSDLCRVCLLIFERISRLKPSIDPVLIFPEEKRSIVSLQNSKMNKGLHKKLQELVRQAHSFAYILMLDCTRLDRMSQADPGFEGTVAGSPT